MIVPILVAIVLRGSGHINAGFSFVQPCQIDSGRNPAAEKSAVRGSFQKTGQVQRMDSRKPPAAPSGAPVFCGTGAHVPPRYFA